MRTFAATTAATILLTAGVTTPAQAAVPDAPTDVQVSWAGDKIRVTWNDNGEANRVLAVFPDTGFPVALPTADAPNEVSLDVKSIGAASKVRISVRSIGADKELSAPAHSPLFDTVPVSPPALRAATSLSTTSVRLRWIQEETADVTPNDPLDQPTGAWLKATVTGPAAGQQRETLIPGGAKTADVPVPAGPVTIKLSAGDEWGTAPAGDFQTARVITTGVSTTVLGFPALTGFGGFNIKGIVQVPGAPDYATYNYDVQARPNSSAPWQKVSSGVTFDKPGTPIFAWLGASGGREYRLWVPAEEFLQDDVFIVSPAASTKAKFVRRCAAVYRAEFTPSTARVSATVKLVVNVEPYLPLKAALQKWNGKQWVHVRAVQLDAKGNANIPIRAAGRGTTTKYRILTPPVKVNGLPVEAGSSKPFTLKVT
ncbi:hypothetical protein OG474_21275 [Kribbella sp. NBC_01505]|uniref:hypothetical protein n=1 Tax=Kribbella sp. NBC_01505 TaxID=2903580 RepID=UPI003869BCB0